MSHLPRHRALAGTPAPEPLWGPVERYYQRTAGQVVGADPKQPPIVMTADQVAAIAAATERRQWRRDLHDAQVFLSGLLLGLLGGAVLWRKSRL